MFGGSFPNIELAVRTDVLRRIKPSFHSVAPSAYQIGFVFLADYLRYPLRQHRASSSQMSALGEPASIRRPFTAWSAASTFCKQTKRAGALTTKKIR
jgi:hypothetical protein